MSTPNYQIISLDSVIQRLGNATYECEKSTDTEHPGHAVLAQVNRRRISDRFLVRNLKDGGRHQRNLNRHISYLSPRLGCSKETHHELRHDNREIMDTQDCPALHRFRTEVPQIIRNRSTVTHQRMPPHQVHSLAHPPSRRLSIRRHTRHACMSRSDSWSWTNGTVPDRTTSEGFPLRSGGGRLEFAQELHDDSKWDPYGTCPAYAEKTDSDSRLPDGLNPERGEHHESEEEKRGGPDVSEHEGHGGEFEWTTLACSFGFPLADHLADAVEFCTRVIIVLFNGLVILDETLIKLVQPGKNCAGDDRD